MILFSSCSSDNDTPIDNGLGSNITEKKYTVNFDIKSAGFEVDKAPMRSLNGYSTYLQIVVYKQAGEVYSDTLITPEMMTGVITDDGKLPFSVTLPEGSYHVAFMHSTYNKGGALDATPEKIKLKPTNFYTDTYGGGIRGLIKGGVDANIGNYYQTIDITMPNLSQNSIAQIELEPMWSTVSIAIEDLTPPSNCNFISIDLAPSYILYNLSDKLAPYDMGTHRFLTDYDGGLDPVKPGVNNGTVGINLNVSKTSSENNQMKLIIRWYKDETRALIVTSEIDLHTQVENGLHYKVRGKLADIPGESMSVSLTPFNKEEIDIPFE